MDSRHFKRAVAARAYKSDLAGSRFSEQSQPERDQDKRRSMCVDSAECCNLFLEKEKNRIFSDSQCGIEITLIRGSGHDSEMDCAN